MDYTKRELIFLNTYFQKFSARNSGVKLSQNNYPKLVDILFWFFSERVLIIGDVRSFFSIFFMIFASKIILFDDGVVTFSLAKDSKHFMWVRFKLKRLILRLIFNFKRQQIELRTVFKLIHNEDLKIIHTPITSIRKTSSKKTLTLFIGSDMIESGLFHKSTFMHILNMVYETVPNTLYYPHRGEKEKYWNGRIQKREEDVLEWIGKTNIIKRVIGFHSTSLIMIKSLYPDIKVEYINIEKKKFIRFYDIYKNTINEFEKYSIEEFSNNNN